MKLVVSQPFPGFLSAAVIGLIVLAAGGMNCSIQKMAVGATGGIIDNTLASLYEEQDLEIAESAIASNLKMLEGLIRSDPGNEKLLLLVTEGYTGYALGFVEDDSPDRARVLYKRARDYGITLLSRNPELKTALNSPLDVLEGALAGTGREDVPALFWTANAWGSYIKLSMSDLSAMADLGRVQALMNRVVELDETFYFGGAHLFLGVIEAEKGITGNPATAKMHLDRALEIANRKFLLTQVLYARHYAVKQLDEKLFDTLLQEVIDTPGGVLPEYRLINEIAKRKAGRYLAMKDEWFDSRIQSGCRDF